MRYNEFSMSGISTWPVIVFSKEGVSSYCLVHDDLIFDSLLLVAEFIKNSSYESKEETVYLERLSELFVSNYAVHSNDKVTGYYDWYDISIPGEQYYIFP